MVKDWITVSRVIISKAEQLYPDGLDWVLQPGVNAIVGGTGLGKTTFVYALLYGIFDKMVGDASERIERDFFRNRLTNRPNAKEDPPTVEIQFSAGGSSFLVKRNLLTGILLNASSDNAPLKAAKYRDTLAEKVGLKEDFPSLVRLQSHLLFFGEGRHLLAWENLLQNELLNLLLSDHATYANLNKLWDDAESADSEARNISAQAARLEKDLDRIGSTNVRELERLSKLKELAASRKSSEDRVAGIQRELHEEQRLLATQEAEAALAHSDFHQQVDRLEDAVSVDLDDDLFNAALAASPTIASVRHAVEHFFQTPNARPCPSCGRTGLSPTIVNFAKEAAAAAQTGHCIICSKEIVSGTILAGRSKISSTENNSADVSAAKLQAILFKREQTKSRIDSLRKQETTALRELSQARESELMYLHQNPATAVDALRITVKEMRSRQKRAERRRDKKLAELRSELAETNAAFGRIQSDMAKAFKKYATLYLDEPCDIKLLHEDELPGKRGPQIKAPHAAFFPIVSGQTRASAQALSDAQRSFIDLAFRMAMVDVWHQHTRRAMTMIVETPEGAVDIAYMERVATMLRTFSNQGHTLIVTTNLNNDVFLPELLAGYPKSQRMNRILNLIELGRPRKVQKAHRAHFAKMLQAVESHAVAR
jgi:DNA repair exonuclease SbcCD ATPase subunit